MPVEPTNKISFADIAGMEGLKKTLRLRIIEPFLHPDLFARFKKSAGGGVLLYDPPGCGKTMMARAMLNHNPKDSDLLQAVKELRILAHPSQWLFLPFDWLQRQGLKKNILIPILIVGVLKRVWRAFCLRSHPTDSQLPCCRQLPARAIATLAGLITREHLFSRQRVPKTNA